MVDMGGEHLAAYWFTKKVIALDELRTLCERTRDTWFKERYLPDMHCVGRIDRALEQQLLSSDVRCVWANRLSAFRASLEAARRELDRLSRLSNFASTQREKLELARVASKELAHLACASTSLVQSLRAGGICLPTSALKALREPGVEATLEVHNVLGEIEQKSRGYPATHYCFLALEEVVAQVDEIVTLVHRISGALYPLAIVGAPGVGKTHAVVACAPCAKTMGGLRVGPH